MPNLTSPRQLIYDENLRNGLPQHRGAKIMTTSSENGTPSASRPEAKNWHEVSCQFSTLATVKFGDWMDEQLRKLEESQSRFVTHRSLAKSLRSSKV